MRAHAYKECVLRYPQVSLPNTNNGSEQMSGWFGKRVRSWRNNTWSAAKANSRACWRESCHWPGTYWQFKWRKKNEYESAITKAEKEQERLVEAKFTLYDHFSKGILSEKDYQQFSKKYDDAIAQLDEDIKSLRKCIADLKEARRLDDEFIAFFEKYGNIQKLDRDVLNSLVDHVVYNSPEHVEIFFNFSAYCNKIHTLANVVSEVDSTG